MSYWHYPTLSPTAGPPGMVRTPPLTAYYSTAAAAGAYAPARATFDPSNYTPSPAAHEARLDREPTDKRRGKRHAHREPASPRQEDRSPPRQRQRQRSPSCPRPATAQERAAAGIPAGYSTKNWDPAEEPIFLLGSVFDANSLGKWIYDWTVYRHRSGSVALDVAGDLWLALIALAGKMRQAENLLLLPARRRHPPAAATRRLLEDFLDDGDLLLRRFRARLRACERSMMKVAQRDRDTGRVVAMGASSGCQFVDCLVGHESALAGTEDLIDSMVIWDQRFDATFRKARKRRPA
ncbi:MAG: hypothetical protein M1826_002580 [Phylliscum demangeonii]|nr:MAG: hypothetical protein M1826_002580 [Phylliscum demangeonii]